MFIMAGTAGKGIVAAISLVTFSTVAAMPGICTELESPCGGDPDKHYAPLMSQGTYDNPHPSCELTSESEFPKHWPECEPLEDGIDLDAYDRAKRLASVGEVQGLIKLGQELPGYVHYNSTRNAVQLVACDGSSIVSSLSVPEVLVEAATLLE